jgi:hypothetical protein
VVSTSPGTAPQQQSESASKIVALEDKWNEAYKQGDVDDLYRDQPFCAEIYRPNPVCQTYVAGCKGSVLHLEHDSRGMIAGRNGPLKGVRQADRFDDSCSRVNAARCPFKKVPHTGSERSAIHFRPAPQMMNVEARSSGLRSKKTSGRRSCVSSDREAVNR